MESFFCHFVPLNNGSCSNNNNNHSATTTQNSATCKDYYFCDSQSKSTIILYTSLTQSMKYSFDISYNNFYTISFVSSLSFYVSSSFFVLHINTLKFHFNSTFTSHTALILSVQTKITLRNESITPIKYLYRSQLEIEWHKCSPHRSILTGGSLTQWNSLVFRVKYNNSILFDTVKPVTNGTCI